MGERGIFVEKYVHKFDWNTKMIKIYTYKCQNKIKNYLN